MCRGYHKVLLFLLVWLLAAHPAKSQRGKGQGNGTIIHFGPVVGFYAMDQRHASGERGNMSVTAGIRRETRADRTYRTFFQFGADYFLHGLGYYSYFFYPGQIKLYNKNFNYEYKLSIHEISIPLQFKILFNRGDNRLFSPYASLSYHLRYLIGSKLQVEHVGNTVKKDFPDIRFRNYLFSNKTNAFVALGLGWQRNKISASGTAFFAELNFRYGFSAYYFEKDYAASSVFINASHLALQLGLKF